MMSGDWPNNNVKAGLANQNDITGKYVKSVRVKDNVIIIMYGNDANKVISNKKVNLTAIFDLGEVNLLVGNYFVGGNWHFGQNRCVSCQG